eukprot:354038-Chlamydomonas_euryale.AAC.1
MSRASSGKPKAPAKRRSRKTTCGKKQKKGKGQDHSPPRRHEVARRQQVADTTVGVCCAACERLPCAAVRVVPRQLDAQAGGGLAERLVQHVRRDGRARGAAARGGELL